MRHLSVVGYDEPTSNAILLIDDSGINILRNLDDFQSLNRKVCPSNDRTGLPSQSYKKLAAHGSWSKSGSGWKPEMTRSVQLLERWLKSVATSYSEHFDLFIDEDEYRSAKKLRIERKQQERRPRMLQQYFASETNIKLLIENCVMDTPIDRIIFIEPSCGDGRIMRNLIQQGAKHVVGCDIDPEMGDKTRLMLNSLETVVDATVYVQDFLTTTEAILERDNRNDLIKVAIASPPYSIISDNSADVMIECSEPKTSDFDYSQSNREDYPLLFLLHCALVLKVCRVALLLPDRCGSSSFISFAAQLLNDSPHKAEGTWRLLRSIPADSSFELIGRVIKQPAVIQVWEWHAI